MDKRLLCVRSEVGFAAHKTSEILLYSQAKRHKARFVGVHIDVQNRRLKDRIDTVDCRLSDYSTAWTTNVESAVTMPKLPFRREADAITPIVQRSLSQGDHVHPPSA